MSWLKTFTLSLEVVCAAVETLFQLGHSDNLTQTQVGILHLICSLPVGVPRGKSREEPGRAVTGFSRFIQDFLNTHCGELVSVCEAYLANILLSANGTQNLNEDLMVRTFLWFKGSFCGTLDVKGLRLFLQVKHLHTLGVASLHCPAKVSKRTVLLVESVLTSCPEKLAGRNDGHGGNMMLWSDSCSHSGNSSFAAPLHFKKQANYA